MDNITVKILPDGRIVWTVEGSVSGPNHSNADNMLRDAGRLAGGTVDIARRAGHTHSHDHATGHVHAGHDGGDHKH